MNISISVEKVGLDPALVWRVADPEGRVSRQDFVKLGQDMKLLEFGGALGDKRRAATPLTPKKERWDTNGERKTRVGWTCCCFPSKTERRDRVMVAFKVWDRDGDGFLSWDEFRQVRKK